MGTRERMPEDAKDSLGPLRRSPSGRTPLWVHDEEVQRLAGAMQQGRAASTKIRAARRFPIGRSKRTGGKRRSPASILMRLVLAVGVAGAGIFHLGGDMGQKIVTAVAGEQFHVPPPEGLFGGDTPWSEGYPPRGIEAEKKPLGQPAPVAHTSDSHSFIDESGAFVAYDPCRPIHYVTRPDNAPPGGQQLITDAVAAASKATGLVFIDDGKTTEGFAEKRPVYQPDLYGKRWAPVLIVWETAQEQPRFAVGEDPGVRNLAGLGGSQPIVGDAGSRVFVTGTVQLSADSFAQIMTTPNGAERAGGVIQHELGHVLGLGHVQDPSQLMYEHGQAEVTTYAAGDLSGLARLGQGKCFANH